MSEWTSESPIYLASHYPIDSTNFTYFDNPVNISNSSLYNISSSQDIEETEPWKIILDKAATAIMTMNTIGLMMGMGAATYWRDVS